jgi:hypothetical protein
LRKAAAEAACGNAGLVVALVLASVGAAWWRELTPSASLVRILPQRIKFGGSKYPANFDSAVIVFGRLPGRHGTEPLWCVKCGDWWFPYRADARTCPRDACRKAFYRARMSQLGGC